MSIQYENLSKGEAFLIDWQYRVLKGPAMELADAIAKSDTRNREVLDYFFPEYTQAIEDFQHKAGYWPAVEVKAGLLDPDWEEKYNQRQLQPSFQEEAV
tara:strand:+ start:394 stop:690 length:297 start_codon:yes stop_codon:yes gene_type:complete